MIDLSRTLAYNIEKQPEINQKVQLEIDKNVFLSKTYHLLQFITSKNVTIF